MGLDVSVFKQVKFLSEKGNQPADYLEREGYLYMYNQKYMHANVTTPGYYTFEERKRMWSSPCTYYNQMRRRLSQLVGHILEDVWQDPQPDIPFVEMLDFADNEGNFDTEVCAKLAKDFDTHQVNALGTCDSDFIEFYNAFHTIFKTAAENNGAVGYS